MALTDRGDHAELALRAVGEGRTELIEILESDCSLEERVMDVCFAEPRLLDQARNLAMTFAWKDGRYHVGFTVGNPQVMNEDIGDAVEAIRNLIQSQRGGRKVYTEAFTYTDPEPADDSKSASKVPVHHIAIYLEAPASVLMEFQPGSPVVGPVVRREAKEMAIEYNPATGRLDVVGKGVGGAKVFRDVANEFRARALADATLTELEHEEWPLDLFRQNPPRLDSASWLLVDPRHRAPHALEAPRRWPRRIPRRQRRYCL